MKVIAVTPADAASSPAHPDHDRWVKDKTLAMEVEHAKRVGIPLRVAEAENIRLLERTERIAKDSRPAKKKVTPGAVRQQRHRDRGVVIKPAPREVKVLKMSPCGRCGKCVACKREQRALLIVQRRKESPGLDMIALGMFVAALHAKAGTGKFKGLSKRDIDRAVTVEVESACDASVRWLGQWR